MINFIHLHRRMPISYGTDYHLSNGNFLDIRMKRTLMNNFPHCINSIALQVESLEAIKFRLFMLMINSCNELQRDLNSVNEWLADRHLGISSQNSVFIRINFKDCKHLSNHTINNVSIPLKKCHKHLGFVLDDKFRFNDNIDIIYSKCIKK